MDKKWEPAIEALSHIEIKTNPENEPVTITGSVDGLICVGIGTDAAVFRYIEMPAFAFKLFAEDKKAQKEKEEKVYQLLGDSPFFPKFHDSSEKVLILDYEEGKTLYDCLLQGVHIPLEVINDVEKARDYVRSRGLNPRDIHLKNILLQNGRAKIIDVSEYIVPGNDFRWEHLKRGYEEYYHYIDGKPVPFWMLNTTRKWYNQTREHTFEFEEFMKKIFKLTMFWR